MRKVVKLAPDLTGLPMTVWVSKAITSVLLRVRVQYEVPSQIAGWLRPNDEMLVYQWAALNEQTLVDYLEGGIDREFLGRLRRVAMSASHENAEIGNGALRAVTPEISPAVSRDTWTETQSEEPYRDWDRCIDCRRADPEYYTVWSQIWAEAGLAPEAGQLCLDCFARRLGRRLWLDDFTMAPVNKEGRSSRRILAWLAAANQRRE